MNLPETGLRWDPEAKKYYRLTPGPGGTGIHTFVDSDRSASNFPPPRTSSRDNPLALPRQPTVTQGGPAAVNPRSPQPGNSPQIPRTLGSAGGRGAPGNVIPPQPIDPYGASRLPNQHSQSASQSGTTRTLSAGLDRLNISDTRPNVAQQGSRQPPSASRTSEYQAAGDLKYHSQAQTGYYSGYQAAHGHPSQPQYSRQEQTGFGPAPGTLDSRGSQQYTHRPVLQSQTAGRGGNFASAQPYVNPYVNASADSSQANDPRSQVPSSQPNYSPQIPYSPYTQSSGYNTTPGAGRTQPSQSPYLQPATQPFVGTATVAPQVPVAARTENPDKQRSQGSPPAGVYRRDLSNYDDETVEDNITAELVRGTKGPYELLDPKFQVVRNHWHFFVVGRVFMYLSWEPQGHGNPMMNTGNSLQKYPAQSSKLGEQAYAKVYRYVVVRARPKQGYSMCLRISTHGARGTVGKMFNQKEHGIIFTGGEAPQKLPGEKKLNKDPIEVIPVDSTQALDPLSRINYAKPYPIEHNVKVREVGKVAPRNLRKLLAYYQTESGYDTEREAQQEPERRTRRESSSSMSKEPERRVRRQSSSSMSKEPERKVRREPKRDTRH